MKIGTYYYPEQWPREDWERDFDRIASMGLRIVHMGEFAWYAMEPTTGRFEFDWLSDCIEMCRQRDLDVILCTPTAAPPIWLSQQYPEILPRDRHGGIKRHGGRRHYNPLSTRMQEATYRIVSAMAERFGDHPSVIGWQIDNEYGLFFDQSQETHAAFQKWLSRKYGTIEALNVAWGNQFWNTYYQAFEQILMPPSRTPDYDNPHHHLDASRFWSWAWAQFNRLQADVLKRHVGSRFITTNFMPLHPDIDPKDTTDDLSLFAWDSYPVSGWGNTGTDQTFRIADPNGIELTHDHMFSFNGRSALLEVQPGTINWSGVPVQVYPGAVRLWLWTAIMHGVELITVYRFRQPRFGIEMFHHGLIEWDGQTKSPGGEQFEKVAREVKQLELDAEPWPGAPIDMSALVDPNTVGLMLDFDQMWYFSTLPQARRWDYGELLRRWYGAIARLGLPVRIIHPDRPWPTGLNVLVAPAMQMVDGPLVERWTRFVREGGHLVLTCRTALMDRTGQAWAGPTAMPILDLIGASIPAYDGLPDDRTGKVTFDGKSCDWRVWGDQLSPREGTRVIGSYADQCYAGTPAITERDHVQGRVTYVGPAGEQALVDAVMQHVARSAGLATLELPERLRIGRRGRYRIACNYHDHAVEVPASMSATFHIGARTLGPAGVAAWTG